MRKLGFFFILISFSSCSVFYPSRMFKTKADFNFTEFAANAELEYKIAIDDAIEIKMFANDGLTLVDLAPLSSGSNTSVVTNSNNIRFTVENDGTIRLPILGKTNISGLSVKEAQKKLEDLYSTYYVKPFVFLKVVNKRIIVFPGVGGSATVIKLENEKTSVIEALALAGGISTNGKSRKIKLIRGERTNPQIQLIDLSSIEGMRKGNILVQANDILYVEPSRNISQDILTQITPILGLLTTALLIAQFLK
jgi:polysaccharide biosynthesis/export protein